MKLQLTVWLHLYLVMMSLLVDLYAIDSGKTADTASLHVHVDPRVNNTRSEYRTQPC